MKSRPAIVNTVHDRIDCGESTAGVRRWCAALPHIAAAGFDFPKAVEFFDR